MNFQEAERAYRNIKQQLDAQQIPEEVFKQRLNELRLQDQGGKWWQLSADGVWLTWDGSVWAPTPLPQRAQAAPPPASKPAQPVKRAAPKKQAAKSKSPETLAQLAVLVAKGFFKSWLVRLILSLFIGLVVWVLHTYLVIGPNGGFALGPNPLLHNILSLRGRMMTGTVFWTLLAILGSMFLSSLVRSPKRTFKGIFSTPTWIIRSLQRTGILGPTLLLGIGALAVLAATFMGNRTTSLMLACMLLGSLIAQQGSLVVVTLRLGWSDAQRLMRPSKPVRQFEPYWAGAGLTGIVLGLFGGSILPFSPYLGCAAAFLMVGAMAAWIFFKKGLPMLSAAALLLVLVIVIAIPLTPAFADDGGWEEAGGSLSSWLQSEGAIVAIGLGLPPSMGAILGTFLGSALTSLLPPSMIDDINKMIGEGLTQVRMNALEQRIGEIIKERIKEGYFVRNPDLISKVWNNSLGRVVEWLGGWKGGQCGEFGEWGQKWSKDSVQAIYGNGAITTDIAIFRNTLINHRASRIITPNGDRVVIDFWEGIQKGKPAIYSEQDWINKWKKELGGTPEIFRSGDELTLSNMVQNYGQDRGFQYFRKTYKGHPDQADALIRSYQKDPWKIPAPQPAPSPSRGRPLQYYQPPDSVSDRLFEQLHPGMPKPKK